LTAPLDSAVQEAAAANAAERLQSRLKSAWEDLNECVEAISAVCGSLPPFPAEATTLAEVRDWYEQTSSVVLVDPVQKFLGLQPLRRVLEALRTCDQESAPGFARSRFRTDRRFLRLMALAALDLVEPWRIWRGGNQPKEWAAWQLRRAKYGKEATELLERYAKWAQREAPKGKRGISAKKKAKTDEYWRQQTALTATLEAELALRNLSLRWFDAYQFFSAEILREREEQRANALATLAWLEAGLGSGSGAPESFGLVTPEERLRAWAQPLESEAEASLPEQLDLVKAGVVRREPKLRSVALRKRLLKTFERHARSPMKGIVEQLWQEGAGSLRQVEQSKEMIVYWGEVSATRPGDGAALLAEARNNAMAAVTEQLKIAIDPAALEAQGIAAFRAWHCEGMVAFEAEQFGWIDLLPRPRARALHKVVVATGRWHAQTALRRVGRWASSQVDRAMETLGGRVPLRPSLPPVVRRTTLRDILAMPTAKTSLPALYNLLFRIASVEDRRFLVGRDQEIAGLAQAVEDWKRGRFAACLLVGARGSGKTSLLNCAVRDVFADQPWIRAEFHERILTAKGLDEFLRRILKLEAGAEVESALLAERRVIILEEAERLYLRKVGGFAAVKYLGHLIYKTASTTLWLIVMNDCSFRVLEASTKLSRVFSHRINAMNVSRADLENAILERHRLSGLRLDFAPPPASDPRVNRARRLLGLEESSQTLYFDSLYQQSAGIFRSAFQLWMSSIERVEGEHVKIRQPLDPAFAKFRQELAQEDQFSLVAIQEHGSLTTAELAEAMTESRDASMSRMERLMALGLIEPDPEHPGHRVVPEAQRFVNDLLQRANLS